MLDAPVALIPLRRHSKRLLEGTAEVVPAQASKLRQSGERNSFRKVFLDVGCDDSLLPAGQPAPRVARGRLLAVGTNKLIDEHGAERLKMAPICRRTILK